MGIQQTNIDMLATILGLFGSYVFNTPTDPGIVCVAGLLFTLANFVYAAPSR